MTPCSYCGLPATQSRFMGTRRTAGVTQRLYADLCPGCAAEVERAWAIEREISRGA